MAEIVSSARHGLKKCIELGHAEADEASDAGEC